MRRSLALVGAVLLASGCATRGTLAELGRPELQDAAPGVRLTLVEPRQPGQLHAYPRGAGDGDYRAETRTLTAPRRERDEKGQELVAFDLVAAAKGDRRLDLLELVVFPIATRDVLRYKDRGVVPEGAAIERFRATKPVPGQPFFRVEVAYPVARVGSADQLGVSILLRFEDGWITIADTIVLVPR